MRSHLKTEAKTPEGMMKIRKQLDQVYGKPDYDSDEFPNIPLSEQIKVERRMKNYDQVDNTERDGYAAVMTNVDTFVLSDVWMNEMRSMYAQRTQSYLLNRRVYTLVECLEETLDVLALGVDPYEIPQTNIYVPVTNTIMRKPDMTAGADEEFGFRHYEYERDRSKTMQMFGPLD